MKRFFLFALVATLFAACSTDATQDLAPEIPTSPDELYVSFAEEDTRIQLQNGAPVWTKGDLVSVFYRSNANQKWQFQGNTGDTTGTLKRVSAGTPTTTTTRVVAVYPYNENYYLNPEFFEVQAFLPAEQTYAADSFGISSSIMISAGTYNQLSLKNVCGWLKLQLTGTSSQKVERIVLRGNNGEQVAGEIYINSADASCVLASEMGSTEDDGIGGTGGNLVFDDAILTEVALNCDGDVALNPETPTAFYIALPPQTFEKGITIDVLWTDGSTMTKSTTNSLTIERNHILPMASIPTQPTPPANEIWYTSKDGNIVKPGQNDVFGATIVSNTYENGKGIIKFNGNVTSIGKYAFEYCEALTSITIPNSVTTIGKYAFEYCEALTSITIPNSVTTIGKSAFSLCYALKSINIPNSVTEIGEEAFLLCSALESVTIGNSVTSIGEEAFEYCYALESFYGKLASEDNRCVIIDGVLKAFAPAGLTSYTIPNSVTSIGNYAFACCYALTSVTIPNSVTSIGERAFAWCDALESFYGKFASEDNRCLIIDGILNSFAPAGLTTYTIPNSVTSIGSYTFYDCDALTSVTIGNSVTSIGYNAFARCDALTSITIGNSVTEIGEDAFQYCSALKSINIPNSVTSIGNYAFYYCSALKSVTIGNGVTSIGYAAFDGCSALESVNIPNSVTSIGYRAFSWCDALKEVYCKPTTPPTADLGGHSYWSAFDGNASGRKIYVPTESVDAYKAASGWSNYAGSIEPYEFTE